jgi:hypothetical protein
MGMNDHVLGDNNDDYRCFNYFEGYVMGIL